MPKVKFQIGLVCPNCGELITGEIKLQAPDGRFITKKLGEK